SARRAADLRGSWSRNLGCCTRLAGWLHDRIRPRPGPRRSKAPHERVQHQFGARQGYAHHNRALEGSVISLPVSDSSHVGEARRKAVGLGESIGFDESGCARIALVVTELATNLIKHGRGGFMLVGRDEYSRRPALEVLSLDRGPGMRSVQSCLEDGHSTSGSPGTGMGAIVRQAHEFDILSLPAKGTAIYVRLEAGRFPEQRNLRAAPFGAIAVAKQGEAANGDACAAAGEVGARTYI